ncbi:hypothetical protein PpBr36_07553 [Pyricularia pennisetigena]|uniref:hypothetical protein n=1 Tax=Pyricularia pennisetigena TaxID=1578925 RepID=UPI001153F242|nr:hypothetical protein PpBr36_07553 [Pyricularia pennisetigena]TLS24960.1 hypothetical protein PpBr36_07553 [Pyricularia pennisetigena]
MAKDKDSGRKDTRKSSTEKDNTKADISQKAADSQKEAKTSTNAASERVCKVCSCIKASELHADTCPYR